MKVKADNDVALTERQIGRYADRLFFYCFLAYTTSYLGRKNLSACLPAMIAEGLLTKPEAGYVTTAYMAVYGFGQICSGLAAARIPPQWMIGIGLFGAGLCNLSMSSLSSLPLLILVWALNGLFHSMLWSPIIRVFTDRLPAGKRERAGVNISASCAIGAVLAYLMPAAVLRFAEWRVVFLISGGALLLVGTIWTVGNRHLRPYVRLMDEACRREREELIRRASQMSETPAERPQKRSLIGVFIASGLWLMLFGLCCNGALRDAVETWAPTFMTESFGLDESFAALITVIIPIVTLIGPYAADSLHKRIFHNEIYTAAAFFGITILCVGGIYLTHHLPFGALPSAILMAVGVAAMFGTNHMFLTAVPYHFAPLGLSATISGVLNSIIYLATALCSSIYGLVAEHFGWTTLILVWLGVGIGGMVFSFAAGRVWKTKRVLLDEGRL